VQWEYLTAAEFAAAAAETGVCVLTLGVLEKHSDHLPLGTDFLTAHRVACLAAEREPAVVFPSFYFGQIYEARCFPGTVTLKPALLLELLQGVLDEIGRNGFRKIILYNGHGGNHNLIRFLAQSALWEERPYSLYIPQRTLTPAGERAWQALRATDYGGHACEEETSRVLGTHPDLVKPERVPETPARPLGRLDALPPTFTGIWWYADHPEHYAGDARPANAAKGAALVAWEADGLAQYIAAVKADPVVPALEAEFFRRARAVGGGGAG
jgi:creatinine amidohydrolase